jgi:TonB family protein
MIRLEDDRAGSKRWPVILGLSIFLHASIIGALVLVPEQAMRRFTSAMNFSVVKDKKKEPEKVLEKKEEKKEEKKPPEKKDKKPRPAVKPKDDKKPEQPPPPPPETKKFQMSQESFSGNGDWGISADIGEERLGSFTGAGKENTKTHEAPLPLPPPPPPPPPPKKVVIRDKPAVIEEVTIPYPAEARRLEIEGDVKLEVSINEKGMVTKVKILKDPGGGLGEAAAKALKKFKFSPAITDQGKAVPYKIKYVYSFVLD